MEKRVWKQSKISLLLVITIGLSGFGMNEAYAEVYTSKFLLSDNTYAPVVSININTNTAFVSEKIQFNVNVDAVKPLNEIKVIGSIKDSFGNTIYNFTSYTDETGEFLEEVTVDSRFSPYQTYFVNVQDIHTTKSDCFKIQIEDSSFIVKPERSYNSKRILASLEI